MILKIWFFLDTSLAGFSFRREIAKISNSKIVTFFRESILHKLKVLRHVEVFLFLQFQLSWRDFRQQIFLHIYRTRISSVLNVSDKKKKTIGRWFYCESEVGGGLENDNIPSH